MTVFKHSDGWWTLRGLLEKGEPFNNSTGNFRGELWTDPFPPPPGIMSPDDYAHMRKEMRTHGIDYVVFSYNTPIAWRTRIPVPFRGYWYSPDAGYTQTTKSKHLSPLRTAIAELNKLAV